MAPTLSLPGGNRLANAEPWRMQRALRLVAATVALLGVVAPAAPATHETAGARVIVSTTLNDTLQFFDSATLTETQPPLPSRGGGPVRLWIQHVKGKRFLFAANHSIGQGSVGAFDLSGDLVTELPLSPFPARAGSVGVAGSDMLVGGQLVPMVFVTNTHQAAFGGCSMPAGSLTAFDASLLQPYGVMREIGTVELSGAQPYAVSVDGDRARAFATSNCSDTLDVLEVRESSVGGVLKDLTVSRTATRETGDGPDGTIIDRFLPHLVYVANIGGGSVDVFDTSGARLTTVPLPGAHAIDLNIAEDSGYHWLVTANGDDDSVSLIDRGTIRACITYGDDPCPAELLRVKTGVAAGSPEGIDYDPLTHRIFVVNKPFFRPSLTVIQVTLEPGQPVRAQPIANVPLGAVSSDVPVPAVIAFDVVVQDP